MSFTTRTSRLFIIVALVAGLAVGVGAAFLLRPSSENSESRLPATSGQTRDGDPDAAAELPEPEALIPAADADDPETAIRGFLAAEARMDWDASYEFLTPELMEAQFTTPAVWVSQHANFPTVTGYEIEDVQTDEGGDTARALTLTGFEAKLDPVLGLVPFRGRTTWALRQTDDGLWRVNVAETENQPLYPNSEGAAETARAWVDARVACEDAADLQEGLVGSSSQAELLCSEDQDETVEIGTVGPLTDSADTEPLIAAFGPGVFGWARTVRVESATPIIAVLAPIGAEWKVVAVLPAR